MLLRTVNFIIESDQNFATYKKVILQYNLEFYLFPKL